MRVRWTLAATGFVLLMPVAGAATFTVDIQPGQAPTYDGPDGLAELTNRSDGQRYVWNLSLPDETTVGTFHLHDVFEVNRTRQIVPTFDDAQRHPGADHPHPHYFSEVPADELRDGPRHAYNATTNASNRTLRLALPGPGPASLELRADRTPPAVTSESPTDVTHIGFELVTRTDEPALAQLRVQHVEGGQAQTYPTQNPAYRQRFPVQGLDANATYRLNGTYRDWSGNERDAELGTVQTAPAPDRPEPVVVPRHPTPNASLAEPVAEIAADVGNASVPAVGVRLFVDKIEVHDGFEVADGSLRHRLSEPLGDGRHVVRVEARGETGGVGIAEWSFVVATSTAPGPAVPGIVGAVLAGLLVVGLSEASSKGP